MRTCSRNSKLMPPKNFSEIFFISKEKKTWPRRTTQDNNNKQIIIQNTKLYTIVLLTMANEPKNRHYDRKKPFCFACKRA